MKRLIAVLLLTLGLLVPAAVSSSPSSSECPDPVEFESRYGFSTQEYVNRVAVGVLTLAAKQASTAAVAAGNLTIDRWSPLYGEQQGMPVLKYADLYFQERIAEFRDGEISFSSALSYLGPSSNELFGCGLADGEQVRASLQGIETVVIEEVQVAPVPRTKSPALLSAIERLERYIKNLSRPGAQDPDGHLAIYKARLLEYQAR